MTGGPAVWAGLHWGRLIGRYSRWAIQPSRLECEGVKDLPPAPRVWVTWHGNNMVALRVHGLIADASNRAFVPKGFLGVVMRGWLEGVGCEVLDPPLSGKAPTAALKSAARALRAGSDTSIAVDGPTGPAHRVRGGALWLARLTGCPLIPTGFAATPALRYPRWDRHLVPLPRARVAAVAEEPITLTRGQEVDDGIREELGKRIETAQERARALLASGLIQRT